MCEVVVGQEHPLQCPVFAEYVDFNEIALPKEFLLFAGRKRRR